MNIVNTCNKIFINLTIILILSTFLLFLGLISMCIGYYYLYRDKAFAFSMITIGIVMIGLGFLGLTLLLFG